MRAQGITFLGLLGLLICLSSGAAAGSARQGAAALEGYHFRVIIPVYGSDELALVGRYLKAGDMVVLYPPRPELKASGLPQQPEYWIQKAKEFKAQYPRVEVIFNFDGIDELKEITPRLPKEIEWVSYDYERWEWTPEYGADEKHTVRYFEEARSVVHKHKKRLFLTPVPFFNDYAIDWAFRAKYLPERMVAWDFPTIASVGEAFNAQFQFFFRDTAWLETTVQQMAADLKRKSPKTLLFVQLGPGSKATPSTDDEVKTAVKTIRRAGANGIVFWFGPGRASWGEKVLPLVRSLK